MSVYIEKQAVMKKFAEVVAPSNNSDFQKPPTWNDAVEIVENFPAADVRPVVRGRWEVVDWVEYDGHGECVHYPKDGLCCTNCKNAFKKKLLWKDHYRPNCGADMRGGDAEWESTSSTTPE